MINSLTVRALDVASLDSSCVSFFSFEIFFFQRKEKIYLSYGATRTICSSQSVKSGDSPEVATSRLKRGNVFKKKKKGRSALILLLDNVHWTRLKNKKKKKKKGGRR